MNAGRRIAPIGSAEIWDANTPIWMDAASTRPTCPEYISCEDYHEQEEFYE